MKVGSSAHRSDLVVHVSAMSVTRRCLHADVRCFKYPVHAGKAGFLHLGSKAREHVERRATVESLAKNLLGLKLGPCQGI